MLLRLVVPDLHLDRERLEGVSQDALPRLPALESMLRFAAPDDAPADWRVLLAGLAGRSELVDRPPAQVVAAAAGLPAPASAWFASPVHLVAGLDHLRLHPAGLLRLDAATGADLTADFARTFGDDGLALHAVGEGLLLTGLHGVEARTLEPSRLLGTDLRQAPPTGPGADRLRRLASEIEMWLHGRLTSSVPSRGLAPNALWLWGGGPAAGDVPIHRKGTPPGGLLHAEDPLARALWRLGGGEAGPQAVDAGHLLASVGPAESPVVACVPASPRGPGDRPMERLEVDWFAPLLAAFRAGRVGDLRLHVGGRPLRLRRPYGWQRWRRPRPWWEALAT